MNVKCPICENSNSQVIYKNYPGYLKDSSYEINKCFNCDSHFIVPKEDSHKIYDIIYSSVNTFGYDRYYRYSKFVKEKKDPLKFLAYSEPSYYPVYQFVKDKTKLRVLEIGCSYGYLSYALHKKGFYVKALDVASKAIKVARENFGDYFFNMDLKEFIYQSSERFDLIIAIELIEHLEKPIEFLSNCKKLLNRNGKIILTTPNKDYYLTNSIWQTDLPPVHISWMGKKGINLLAEKQNFVATFCDFSNYLPRNENRLFNYMSSRKEKIGRSSITSEGKPVQFARPPLFELIYFYVFNRISVLRFISNLIHNVFNGSENTLGIILEQKRN